MIIQSKETKTISLIPADFKNRIWYSDVCIYNSTCKFVVVGKILQKSDGTRKFVSIFSQGSDITVSDDSGNIVISNSTSYPIEVFCSSPLRTY